MSEAHHSTPDSITLSRDEAFDALTAIEAIADLLLDNLDAIHEDHTGQVLDAVIDAKRTATRIFDLLMAGHGDAAGPDDSFNRPE